MSDGPSMVLIGTQTRPARWIPNSALTNSTELLQIVEMFSPGLSPRCTRVLGKRLASRSSSVRVTRRAPSVTATRSGNRAAARFKRSPIATRPMRPGPGTPPVADRSLICSVPRICVERDHARSPNVRHCEERSDEAIHSFIPWRDGLLRCARNDDVLALMPGPKNLPRFRRARNLAARLARTGRDALDQLSIGGHLGPVAEIEGVLQPGAEMAAEIGAALVQR